MATDTAKKAGKRVLDFTNVKDAGEFNPKQKPEGDYRGIITKVTESVSKNENDMWTFTVQLKEDRSATYPHRCTLNVESLWKVRNLFVAAGKQVPKKKVNVDPNILVGKEIGIALIDEEYNDKVKSVIDSVFPASDLVEEDEPDEDEVDDVEEEEESTAPRRAAKKPAARGKKPAPVEDDEEEVTDEDEEVMDVDDL